jgi:3-deoxy-7-phosphoheptulonate synthase
MSNTTDDLRIRKTNQLISPEQLIGDVAVTDAAAETVASARQTIHRILAGEDDRLLVVVGPCSIHDPAAAREYGSRLRAAADKLAADVFVVMRVYFEKPRTTVGWKGLINDPDLNNTFQINKGLHLARQLLLDLADMGLPAGTEYLDLISPQYYADLIAWGAIGARTTESQTHRQMASGLSMPLGFKNTTSGDLSAATNAVKAASRPQTFLGVSEQGVASAVSTTGNPHCHVILRGGENGPNYDESSISSTREILKAAKLDPVMVIDASHANCEKDDRKMADVFREIVRQRAAGDTSIIGTMLESNLVAGNQPFPQPLDQLVRGQSITDKCIDWELTDRLLREAAAQL